MKIALASDHGGFSLKEEVKRALLAQGHEVVDLGTDSEESVDYPVFAQKCAQAVASGDCGRGILFCGTGIGMCMAANKVKGIRCAVATSDEYARLAAEHNHANILALGGRFTEPADALRYIGIWLTTEWAGGRHGRRVEELDEML
ncbi:MAG: ribose 5-phosphate isomerase B [Clostridiales Family XIII bacterium]|jgi:ribose 5-phosphate isomerase B|nr:ribose 5-phosphate isomerase B [Clostridiales Family XIII bacterium]